MSEMKTPFEEVVAERHAKVREIIGRHLTAIKDEILKLDPATMNIDSAADKAEIAYQVLDELGEQLRGFCRGAREKIAEEKAEFGDVDE